MRAITGLRIDWETGEGAVDLPERFFNESALFRADVLKDWLGYFVGLYRETIQSDLPDMFEGIQIDHVRKIVEGRDAPSSPESGASVSARAEQVPADDADTQPPAQARLSGCARHPEAGLTALYDGETGVLTVQCRACSEPGPSFLIAFEV